MNNEKIILDEFTELYERSKDDHASKMIVGSDAQQLIKETIVLRNEVRAARFLGDASPLALEYCKQQWLDAVRATDEFDKERMP